MSTGTAGGISGSWGNVEGHGSQSLLVRHAGKHSEQRGAAPKRNWLEEVLQTSHAQPLRPQKTRSRERLACDVMRTTDEYPLD